MSLKRFADLFSRQMSSVESKPLPKPPLHGYYSKVIKMNLVKLAAVMITGGLLYYMLYLAPKKKAYHDYYKYTDMEKEFEKIRETGAFDSCR